MVRLTLERMADGGIHDQLGGGFCRYSVDAEWTIPHFEKMLYDNGPLVALYADLARVTGDARHAEVAHGIVGWLTREMRAPDGAFYSSLDADSEGEEGKFYVWTRDEVRAAVAPEEFAVAAPHYGLDRPPNFEGHAWNLRVAVPLADVAARLAIPLAVADRAARGGEGGAPRGARIARAARARRQDPDVVERARDRGTRPRRARARRARVDRSRGERGRRAAPHGVARRPAPRDAQGRARAPQRLSRRPRVPARGAPRAHAGAVSRRRTTRGRARSPTCCWSRFEDAGARRLLLHEPRPRAALSPDQARPRQRDAVGERRRRSRADRARPPVRRSRATSRRASARCGCSRRRSRNRPGATRRC